MCRWLAYSGPPMRIDRLLLQPANSLIRQSLHSQRGAVPTNGDGFGVGWYGERSFPGVFRDTLPAWNDANLRSLAEQSRARLFFAHVRASTGTSTSRENCHPFAFENFLFMHNGKIGGYARIRREIEHMIPAALYQSRVGTTDSEAFFLLAIGNGLIDDPARALARTIGQVTELMRAHDIEDPFRMTAALSDGERIVAVRYSSDHQSPTLYYAIGGEIDVPDREVRFTAGRGSVLVLSEPLDEHEGPWLEVPEGHVLESKSGDARVQPLAIPG